MAHNCASLSLFFIGVLLLNLSIASTATQARINELVQRHLGLVQRYLGLVQLWRSRTKFRCTPSFIRLSA